MKKLLSILLIFVITMPLFARTFVISYSDEFPLSNQYNSGTYWTDNCGAASLYMCLDYMDINLGKISDIRNNIKPYSGWLYTDEIEKFLDDNNVEYTIEFIRDDYSIINALTKGIVMLCLDISKVSRRDYYGGTGHFIVVVGYIEDKNGKYLEVYDPMSYEVKYYKFDEVLTSAYEWWGCMFVFEKQVN